MTLLGHLAELFVATGNGSLEKSSIRDFLSFAEQELVRNPPLSLGYGRGPTLVLQNGMQVALTSAVDARPASVAVPIMTGRGPSDMGVKQMSVDNNYVPMIPGSS